MQIRRGAGGIVPQQIRDYVTKNYPKQIVAIECDRRDYEVELDNGLDLKFDLKFRQSISVTSGQPLMRGIMKKFAVLMLALASLGAMTGR